MGGELSLDGAVKPIRGVLPLAIAARDGGFEGVIVPAANAAEAALVDRIEVIPVAPPARGGARTCGARLDSRRTSGSSSAGRSAPLARALDMADVRGQGEVKEALELAAAGGHNVADVRAARERARRCSPAGCRRPARRWRSTRRSR